MDAALGAPHPLGDRRHGLAVRARQHDLAPPEPERVVAAPPRLERPALLRRQPPDVSERSHPTAYHAFRITSSEAALGAFAGGLLGEALGLRAVGVIAAAGVFLAFLWVALSPVRSIRSLPTESLDTAPATAPPSELEAAAPLQGAPESSQAAAERT